jgi:hypothetical protein
MCALQALQIKFRSRVVFTLVHTILITYSATKALTKTPNILLSPLGTNLGTGARPQAGLIKEPQLGSKLQNLNFVPATKYTFKTHMPTTGVWVKLVE